MRMALRDKRSLKESHILCWRVPEAVAAACNCPEPRKFQTSCLDTNRPRQPSQDPGMYTAISSPPEKGRVVVLNPFTGSWIYSRKSLYKVLHRVLSAMTTAPLRSRG